MRERCASVTYLDVRNFLRRFVVVIAAIVCRVKWFEYRVRRIDVIIADSGIGNESNAIIGARFPGRPPSRHEFRCHALSNFGGSLCVQVRFIKPIFGVLEKIIYKYPVSPVPIELIICR